MTAIAGTLREESQAMEFSVNESALLNELTTAQGVIERKTTIPILSNLLVELHTLSELYVDYFVLALIHPERLILSEIIGKR